MTNFVEEEKNSCSKQQNEQEKGQSWRQTKKTE